MSFLDHFDYIQIIPIVTVALIVIGGMAALFIKPNDFQNSRTFVFISVMASIAVVILACNVFLSTINLEIQKQVTVAEFTKNAVDKLWLYPNRLFAEKRETRPEFLASLAYNNFELFELTKNIKTRPSFESFFDEQFITAVIIQCWEDFLTFRVFDKTGDRVWLNSFIVWAQSPYLKTEYERLKHTYAPTTVELSALLFEYAAKLPVPTPDSAYHPIVEQLLADQRLQKIFAVRERLTV